MAAKEVLAVAAILWAGDKVFNDKVLSGNDAQPVPAVVEVDTQYTHHVIAGEGPIDIGQDCTQDTLSNQAVTGHVVDAVEARGYPLQVDENFSLEDMAGLPGIIIDCRGPKQ